MRLLGNTLRVQFDSLTQATHLNILQSRSYLTDNTIYLILLRDIRRGADKSLAFPTFIFATQPKEFFLDGLKKLEQRSHKFVELRVNTLRKCIFSVQWLIVFFTKPKTYQPPFVLRTVTALTSGYVRGGSSSSEIS
jgi:hypothetical protein